MFRRAKHVVRRLRTLRSLNVWAEAEYWSKTNKKPAIAGRLWGLDAKVSYSRFARSTDYSKA